MKFFRNVRAAVVVGLLLSALGPNLALAFNGSDGISDGARWTAPQYIASGELVEYPDVATDGSGVAWVTWVSLVEEHEHIFVRSYHGLAPGPPLDVGTAEGLQFFPRIIASGDQVWIAWCLRDTELDKESERWRIAVREIDAGRPRNIELVSAPNQDALRPALGLSASGQPWVAWESRVGSQFRVLARPLGDDARRARSFAVAVEGELNLRPVVTAAPEGGVFVLWDTYDAGSYHVMARRVDDEGEKYPAIRISDRPGNNVGPGAATGPDGNIYVAFAANADGAGRPRVGKYIQVKVLREGSVYSLAGGQPAMIATAPGRLDAVEFPTVKLDEAGRLWVFVRRGQGFAALRYEGETWFPPIDFSEEGWGGRGRELRAASSPDGFHLVARRLHMLAHQLLVPPEEGAPPIVLRTNEGDDKETGHIGEVGAAMMDAGREWRTASKAAKNPVGEVVLSSLHLSDFFLWGSSQPAQLMSPDLNRYLSFHPLASSSWDAEPQIIPPEWIEASDSAQRHEAGYPLDIDNHWPVPVSAARELVVLPDGVGPPRPALPSAVYSYKGEALDNLPSHRERSEGFFFGDLHTHSWMSDGASDPDEIYTRSRDRYHFDFVAVTDHGNENGNILLPSEWAYLKLLADFFYKPDHFVTFVAYEWTSPVYPAGAGHRNVYFPGADGPLLDAVYKAPETTTLFELLKSLGAIAIPHHIGWTGTDWERHDPEVQRLAEIVSVHGAFEKPGNKPILPRHEMPGMFIRDALSRGLKFGLVGGSDGHGFPWHYGVSRREDVWRTGLTGLLSPALTRLSLFTAMHNRLTIATSGPPISIWFTVNGAPMGSELVVDRNPRFDIRVEGTAPIRQVVLVRDGGDVLKFPGQGRILSRSVNDELMPGPHSYYLRVVQVDNEVAWTSPVWVSMRGKRHIGPPDP